MRLLLQQTLQKRPRYGKVGKRDMFASPELQQHEQSSIGRLVRIEERTASDVERLAAPARRGRGRDGRSSHWKFGTPSGR